MAATEFEDSIPLDVAQALFDYGGSGRFAVYADIMDEFPEFQIPDGVTVLGSAYFINSLRVALSTELDIEQAVQAIEESFIDSGWESMPSFDPMPNRSGFIASGQVAFRGPSLCHDEFGQISLSTRSGGATNQIVLSMGAALRRNWGNCAQLRAQQEQQMAMMQGRAGMGFQQYMPRLVVPEEAGTGQRPEFMLGGTSSSGNSAETEMELEIDWSMEDIFRHFADQMTAQDWALDTESIGQVSANGTWTRSPEDNVNLVGSLNVVSLGDNRFQLKLSIEGLGGNSGMSIIRRN